ncbi:MAG TPA: VOC family protein [Roseiflexaceae bacterium]|nr:VOC family protein [Roseiflexaceae bacterium]HMP42119.1 VOC family protein [Roseiflexaceae bacterium]
MTTHTHAKPNGTPTWLDLSTPDPDAARAFYHAVFGWEYDISGPEYGGYAIARLGQRSAAGVAGPMPGTTLAKAEWGLFFATDRIDADVNHAVALGATVLHPTMSVSPFGSMATCTDPTGAAFSFWQADQHIGSQVNDEPGAAAWYELYTPDAQQACTFYTALLGAAADLMPGGMEYYTLKHGEHMLAGIMQIDPAWGPMQPAWVAYFGVADADTAVSTVIAHGGAIMGTIDDSPFGRIAALRDSQGAVFKIVEVAAS